jgi:mRNA deadenylase 3'-5' endonuclease subunit Ccr4
MQCQTTIALIWEFTTKAENVSDQRKLTRKHSSRKPVPLSGSCEFFESQAVRPSLFSIEAQFHEDKAVSSITHRNRHPIHFRLQNVNWVFAYPMIAK